MARERFLQRQDRDEDEPQPRRGSGKTRKRLMQASAVAAVVLPVAPGTALAQAPSQPNGPNLVTEIMQQQQQIWVATNGSYLLLPRCSYSCDLHRKSLYYWRLY